MDTYLIYVVIILQIVTIALVAAGGKKQKRDHKGFKRPGGGESGPERKDADLRRGGHSHGKKPHEQRSGGKQQQNRPQQQQSQPVPAAIDPMEKSLRDINLRLKNAEREQESVRKKLNDSPNGAKDAPRQQLQRPPRPPRDGNGTGRDDRPPRREFNRDERGNRGERPPRPEQRPEHTAPADHDMHPANAGGGAGDLQHGRRFTAKRRQLPDGAADDTPETGAQPANGNMPNAQIDEGRGNDVMFGRR